MRLNHAARSFGRNHDFKLRAINAYTIMVLYESVIKVKVRIKNCGKSGASVLRNSGKSAVKKIMGLGLVMQTK